MGNLLTRRALAVLLALVLAVLAAVAVSNYVQNVRLESVEAADERRVYVATGDIPVGTFANDLLDSDLVELTPVPQDVVADDAIAGLTDLTDRFVREAILAGDPLVERQFTDPLDQPGRLEIPPEHQAMSVQLAIPPGVAGFVRKGDAVSVIASLDVGAATTGSGPDGQLDSPGGNRSEYLIQDVEVLDVGRRVAAAPGGTDETVDDTGGVLLTLAVRPEEAEKLVFAAENGTLWFTLLPSDESRDAVTTPGRNVDNLFDDS